MKKIAFVILTYNSDSYIEDCLDSILNIKRLSSEIFITDNGSSDKTVEIIENYLKKYDNICLTKLDKNYGTTYSRNISLHKVKENTDYICILDSDTIINEKAFLEMIDYLQKHNDVGLVGPGMKYKDGAKQTPYRKFPSWKIKIYKACPLKSINKKGEELESFKDVDISEPFESEYLISACWLMPYSTYKKVGDLDEKIFYSPEDVDYCLRIWENNLKIVHIPNIDIVHIYQRISKQKFISKTNISHIKGLHYLFKKHKEYLKQNRKGN